MNAKMMRTKNKWRHVFVYLISLMSIVWSVWVLQPWQESTTSMSFDFLRSVYGGDEVWGAIPLTAGLLQAIGVHFARPSLMSLSTAWWTFLTIGFMLGNISGTGWPVYGYVATACLFGQVMVWEDCERNRIKERIAMGVPKEEAVNEDGSTRAGC